MVKHSWQKVYPKGVDWDLKITPKTPVGKLSKKELVAEEKAKREPARATASDGAENQTFL